MNRILIVIAVLMTSCKIVQLPESTVDSLPNVKYIEVSSAKLIVGGTPSSVVRGTAVLTGKQQYSLVNTQKEKLLFENDIEMLNFFAQYGWVYRDYRVHKMTTTPDIKFYLLEKK